MSPGHVHQLLNAVGAIARLLIGLGVVCFALTAIRMASAEREQRYGPRD